MLFFKTPSPTLSLTVNWGGFFFSFFDVYRRSRPATNSSLVHLEKNPSCLRQPEDRGETGLATKTQMCRTAAEGSGGGKEQQVF